MLGLIVLAGLALTAVLWSALWVAVAVRSAREAHEARMREALANARAELIEHGEVGQLEAFRRKAPRANLWVLDDFESESEGDEPPTLDRTYASEASRARLAAATADARARLAAIDARTAAELEAIRARPGLVVVDDLEQEGSEAEEGEARARIEAREAIDEWLRESWVARVLAAREAFRRKPPRGGGLDDLWTCRANERPPTPAAIEWVERRLAEQARFEDVST